MPATRASRARSTRRSCASYDDLAGRPRRHGSVERRGSRACARSCRATRSPKADLVLQASASQTPVSNQHTALVYDDPSYSPCARERRQRCGERRRWRLQHRARGTRGVGPLALSSAPSVRRRGPRAPPARAMRRRAMTALARSTPRALRLRSGSVALVARLRARLAGTTTRLPRPADPPSPMPVPRGLQLGARVGYALPTGRMGGGAQEPSASISDLETAIIPIGVDAGYPPLAAPLRRRHRRLGAGDRPPTRPAIPASARRLLLPPGRAAPGRGALLLRPRGQGRRLARRWAPGWEIASFAQTRRVEHHHGARGRGPSCPTCSSASTSVAARPPSAFTSASASRCTSPRESTRRPARPDLDRGPRGPHMDHLGLRGSYGPW